MTAGICVAFVTTFLFLPAMMAALPAPASAAGGTPEAGMTVRFAGWVQRYGTGVLLVTAVLLIAAVLGVSRLKVENRFIDYFKESTEIYQGMELLMPVSTSRWT